MVTDSEIQKGYQKTDIGIIPDEWIINQLDSISEVIDPHPSHRAPKFDLNGIPFVGIGDLNENGEIRVEKVRLVSREIYNEHRIRYNLSEKLIGLGRVASIGKVVDLKEQNDLYTISPTLGLIKPIEVIREYLLYVLKSESTSIQFKQIMSGSTRSSVGMIVLRQLLIPLPPTKEEQTAIATILSDADKLITELERLIAKKKLIKQGAMQELLKPKEGWKVSNLGDVFDFKQGVQCPVEKQYFSDSSGLKRFIRIIDLTQPDEPSRYIKDPGSNHHITKSDLFMVRYGTPGLLGYGYEGVIANNLFRLIPKKKIETHFFFYLLLFKYSEIAQVSSSTTMAALNFTTLKELNLSYPIDSTLQIEIAKIFADMDSEIELLEKKLDKYKMIKQGMMQNLLTGKIRLV